MFFPVLVFAAEPNPLSSSDVNLNYLLTDHLGSTRVIIDEKGKELQRFDYYPYGEAITEKVIAESSEALAKEEEEEKLRFTGKERDKNTTLDYFGARYLTTNLGRWVSVDPIQDGWNRYGYVSNNPINLRDRNGLQSLVAPPPGELTRMRKVLNNSIKKGNKKVKLSSQANLLDIGSNIYSIPSEKSGFSAITNALQSKFGSHNVVAQSLPILFSKTEVKDILKDLSNFKIGSSLIAKFSKILEKYSDDQTFFLDEGQNQVYAGTVEYEIPKNVGLLITSGHATQGADLAEMLKLFQHNGLEKLGTLISSTCVGICALESTEFQNQADILDLDRFISYGTKGADAVTGKFLSEILKQAGPIVNLKIWLDGKKWGHGQINNLNKGFRLEYINSDLP
ncbi:MAG: RHS repeat-associated core domain-containing protein [Parcubacteria group bacterium]|nr:RHS repeat-associated core domain-containing protein [Parcubacteria group bacterium]